jgi:uncharacterized membrane protein
LGSGARHGKLTYQAGIIRLPTEKRQNVDMQERSPDKDSGKPSPGSVDLGSRLAQLTKDDLAPSLRLGARLRNYFLTGLVIVGPVTITLYIAWYFINLVDNWVKPYIPNIYNPSYYIGREVPGVGLIFAIVGLMLIGALAANLIGRSLISAGEMMLTRMPIVRNVYGAIKQVFESVVTAHGPDTAFQKVAVMEFPSPGIYALVFVTGRAAHQIDSLHPGDDLMAVFMPTHLVPPSGFTVFVPRQRVTPIDMSFEDAAKIILSAGMANPDTQAQMRELANKSKGKGNGKVTTGAPAIAAPAPSERVDT